MKIKFSYDKNYNKQHHQVSHSDITENEILEVFSNTYIKFLDKGRVYRVIGHTNLKRFLIIVAVFPKNPETINVITAYPAKKIHIIKYHQEVNKND